MIKEIKSLHSKGFANVRKILLDNSTKKKIEIWFKCARVNRFSVTKMRYPKRDP